MSWRRLRILIQHLPPESATWTALRNSMDPDELAAQADKGEPEKARWSQLEQLVAVVADRVAHLEWALWTVNIQQKSKRPDPPEPIRRPGARPRKAKAKLNENSADRLFQLIQGGAE
ncbi:hypothetical protein [Streptomyces griseoloalbus]|uniref:Uncharacterized protein n=1 Tax=Streptomyces griseoloalbus TaxID=67303 RepID=A0A7W8FB31_9ACTN|nr:hypothetical protein [Streptomyces albaduncus]MBB5129828.1 hypothetical protein [Streptomyces albaduncus]GGW80870.1 hypothetical protein GCM10010340_68740 [Streptomyces albaduncus]